MVPTFVADPSTARNKPSWKTSELALDYIFTARNEAGSR